MNLRKFVFSKKLGRVTLTLLAVLLWGLGPGFTHGGNDGSPATKDIDWNQRVDKLLKVSQEGDIILTAVGDMIYNEEISHFTEPHYKNLYRIMRDARLAYGNLEMSLNERPELQRSTYLFRRGRDFAWEIVKLGINMVSLANNHAFDYGTEGLKDCMRILRTSGITYAGAGMNLAQARAGSSIRVQKTRFALLSFDSSPWVRWTNPNEPSIATVRAPRILLEKEDGKTEAMPAPLKGDVKAMEDAIIVAKRNADIVIVAFHFHWASWSMADGIPNKVPPHQTPVIHRAIDAGADIIIGAGPHVLRGIEIYKGKPIFYSIGNFVYHWKTPGKIPPIIWERSDETSSGVIGSDPSLRGIDVREVCDSVLVRFTIRDKKIHRIELIPVITDDRGPHMGDPRLVNDKRGKEIIDYLQKLSKAYGTKILYKEWYGVVEK